MVREGLVGLGILIGYYALVASLTALLSRVLKSPSELTRKILHIACVMSVPLLLRVFSTWYMSALVSIAFALVVYPLLVLIERLPLYAKFLAERREGEVKTSMVLAYLMIATLISVFWGWLGTSWKFIIIVAVMAWGYGDAAAALVGKAMGRHYIQHRFVEGKKTVEGTLAMWVVSWLAIFITTMVYAAVPWYQCLIIAILVAPVCALVELMTRRGMDTMTVPFSAAISVFILISSFAFLGV